MKRLLAVIALVLILAAVAVGLRFRADLALAQARLDAGSQVLVTPCGPIEYASTGSGPALLAIHGAGGGYDQIDDFAGPLAAAGHRVVPMSRFGYLRTPLPADASPEAQADAHACLLDALEIVDAAVFGASAGAPSAMQFCLRHAARCRALVLLVPVAYAEGRAPAATVPPSPYMQTVLRRVLTSDFVIWTVTRLAPQVLVETVLATPMPVFEQASPAEQARALRMIRGIFPVGRKARGLANDSATSPTIPRYALEAISAPTLVISAEDDLYDTFAAARYTAAHVPGARMIGFTRGGHGWLGHHDEVLEAVIGFLDAPRSHSKQ